MNRTTLWVLGILGTFAVSMAAQCGLLQALLVILFFKTAAGQVTEYRETPYSSTAPAEGNIWYAFSVDGKPYRENGIRPIMGFSAPQVTALVALTTKCMTGKAYIDKTLLYVSSVDTPDYMKEHYPVGKVVMVYYNPMDPRESLLEPFRSRSEFWRRYFPGGHFWYKG
jgi:hypothetical protein